MLNNKHSIPMFISTQVFYSMSSFTLNNFRFLYELIKISISYLMRSYNQQDKLNRLLSLS